MRTPVRVEITPHEGSVSRVILLDHDPGETRLRQLCDVIVDEVVESVVCRAAPSPDSAEATAPGIIEVGRLPGVTDAEARAVEMVASRLGFTVRAATAHRHAFPGASPAQLAALATDIANGTVDRWALGCLPPDFESAAQDGHLVEVVAISGLDAGGLAKLSRDRLLSLDGAELATIQSFFGSIGREPTDAELETLAQTWSEHCSHKTFRADIELSEDGVLRTVPGLLRLLRRATDTLDCDWVRSAFVDNAGIVAFTDDYDLAIKVETHNHPSALEPFGGANTGVGGVVRDILGVSARPIACVDVLCFAPADTAASAVPAGVLPPSRIRAGVVAGIGDYGNKLGLPTVAGAVVYHPGYLGNPLVYCGSVGLLPTGSHPTSPQRGDRVVVAGGRTGRDGIHGATFSSADLAADTAGQASSAVQIGDPITEKQLIELVEVARDTALYSAITDCGAGGLSSAVGELAAAVGARVDLALAPRKYPGLQPWEVWLSESQERMVFAVPPDRLDGLAALAELWSVELTDLGEMTGDGRLVVLDGDQVVVDLSMAFLHDGRPPRTMQAVWNSAGAGEAPTDAASQPGDLTADLLALLADPTVASKESIVRTYDHEVRGGTLGRPWCGPGEDGPADAAVFVPLGLESSGMAAAIGIGINPRYGADPYRMALAAIDEAFRNLICVGADPDRVALLDNFCWGNPTLADRLGELVRATEGCADGAALYGAPFVSGKDSLFNEFDGQPIPGTILITALGRVLDTRRVVNAAGASGQVLYLVGETRAELGGSLWAEHRGRGGGVVPSPLADPLARYRAIHTAIRAGWVAAAHDCSEGGLAVALAELAIAGRVGVRADLDTLDPALGDAVALFSESCGRVLLCVAPQSERDVVGALAGLAVARLGELGGADRLVVTRSGAALVDVGLDDLLTAWRGAPL